MYVTVTECLQRDVPDLEPSEFHDSRVFGPTTLYDTHTDVRFYNKWGRLMRRFEISIDGTVTEVLEK